MDENLTAHPDRSETLVVGIGASAGGLDAISELLAGIPSDTEVSVIVVQHLDPTHASLLVPLLQKVSHLPVNWAVAGTIPTPGHVHIAPPGKSLTLTGGRIDLADPAKRHGDGVDGFLQSLAETFAHRAVAVILSGNGSDGAAGVRAIKGAGGIVFAQKPATAQFPSMPRAAIDTGCVDRVLPVAQIGAELVRFTAQSRSTWEHLVHTTSDAGDSEEARNLGAILRLVAAHTGVDYSVYKPNTIKRRLARRMLIVKATNARDYLKQLHKHRDEIAALHESMLINVTEFFRDPECFGFLQAKVLPEILQRHDGPIRIWVPGCATGEEVYTYGILLRELMEDAGRIIPAQIFGTDVSDSAIAQARTGIFRSSDVHSISPERLQRFFHATERGFLVQKPIRDMCVFARQNVFRDAPFSRLDILSCRNLLIYLAAPLQQKLMPMFHYALNPAGALVLGHSESVGGFSDLFRPIDPRFRVYTRRPTVRYTSIEFSMDKVSMPSELKPAGAAKPMPESTKDSFDAIREADRIVASRRGPPALLVNEELDIVQFRGEVMSFLAPVPGRATLKVLDMAREGLATELRGGIGEAREKNVRVQRTGLSIMQGDVAREIALEISPFSSLQNGERFYLIEFITDQPLAKPVEVPTVPRSGTDAAYLAQIGQLRQDLEATRNYLQSTIEKHEATNQDLRAANEEIQSSNEELQSTNEELETAKEELQSTNEELSTVNDELHHRHIALVQANNDLTNLIASVHLPILILGQDLTIRRFTPAAEKVFNLISSDVGRPLSDINSNLVIKDLAKRVADTIDSLTITEFEVKDTSGSWYAMRLRPYKTADNRIEGVVVTLIDISELKRTIAALEASRDFERAVFETAREPLVALDGELRIRTANRAFYRLFGLEREVPENRSLFEATSEQGTFVALKRVLSEILPDSRSVTDHRVDIHLPNGSPATFMINARQIIGDQPYPMILLSLEKLGATEA